MAKTVDTFKKKIERRIFLVRLFIIIYVYLRLFIARLLKMYLASKAFILN